MDKTLCQYHPAQPSTWQCVPCQRYFGDCCIPLNSDAPDDSPVCPLCRSELTFLGAANTAQPFWERLPRFFAYGLQANPLAFCALLALAGLFMPRSLILWVALLSVATKYFHSVIEASSEGAREAPGLVSAFTGEGLSLFFKQMLIFIIAFGALWLAADFHSETIFWGVNIAIVLLLPASIIRLALSKELGAALSPDQVGEVIKAMGWRYLILCAFLFILWQSPSYVAWMLSGGLPKVVLVPIATFLFGYFGVVMCNMMGYAVFQYQGALGFAVAEEGTQQGLPENDWRRRRALAEAEIRLKEGQSDGALETLANALQRDPDDLRLNERYHQLLFGLGARERCLRHVDHYLPLAARQTPALAATALLNARQFKDDFLPAEALVCEQVAAALLDRHKVREALSLLRNLHQRFPDYPHIPRAYLLAARGFTEGLGQLDSARKLLAYIRARYPASPLLDQVAALEGTIAKLSDAGR
ncbi:hypothetical protein [Pseudomonas sp. TCU-HL1]|uniref:hypothetical protein n=1 Tax=Pseudomonas sp. TCU-HL1 TaxID=1856685 RepID=UPI00083D30D4|nr:hypothetical protein [Pseudomonas sp. TCU-HL1]AOE87463.1 hypothetical protein THL1_4915 [Pseudomonas sp. TCU-HL1]